MTSLCCVHFFGGSIYSWVTGRRNLPDLYSLLPPCAAGRLRILVLSYGAIDCRCHSGKWISKVESLSEPYVMMVQRYAAECCGTTRVVPVILAVPPTAEHGGTEAAPLCDSLELRARATTLLNRSMEAACARHGVPHTGADTWAFAQDALGGLRSDISDGHGHVLAWHCGPVHERIRKLIQREIIKEQSDKRV